MKNLIKIILAISTIALISITFTSCTKSTPSSINSIVGTYVGHGTDSIGNPRILQKVTVISLGSNKIQLSSNYFPTFKTDININLRNVMVSSESSSYDLTFNTDLKNLALGDNDTEITFAGYKQ